MDWPIITLADVLEARKRIRPYLRPTPLYDCASLNEGGASFVSGCEA